MVGIYKITSPSGRIYVGQSVDLERREASYRASEAKGQHRLRASFFKYGVSEHVFEVVEECSEDELNVRERHWQDFYNVISEGGLNCRLTATEDKSGRLSEETKKRIGEAGIGKFHSKESIAKMAQKKLGHSVSEETKEKLRQANIGKKMSEEAKRKIGEAAKGRKIDVEALVRRVESRRKNAELKGKKY